MTFPSNKIYQGDFDTLQHDILQAVLDLYIEDSEVVTTRTISDRIGDVSHMTVYKRLNALVRDDYMWRDGQGNYGKWYLSQRGLKKLSPSFPRRSREYRRLKFVTELARQAKD